MRAPKGISRVCADCGRRTPNTRCAICSRDREQARQRRQWYRTAYQTPERRRARQRVMRRDAGICQYVYEADGEICGEPATEVHELKPISSATTLDEAIHLASNIRNMVAVCHDHNPRGGRVRRRHRPAPAAWEPDVGAPTAKGPAAAEPPHDPTSRR